VKCEGMACGVWRGCEDIDDLTEPLYPHFPHTLLPVTLEY